MVPLPVLWALLVRHRRLLIVLALLGAMVGAAGHLVLSPSYESRTKVVLQGVRESSQMQSESQIAMSQVVLERAARRLEPGSAGPVPAGSVTASSDGNVVEIVVAADGPERARRLAELVTEEYIGFSRQLLTDATAMSTQVLKERQTVLQQRLDAANRGIRDLLANGRSEALTVEGAQARGELNRLRAEAGDAVEELNQLYARMQDAEAEASVARAGTRVIEPPTEPRDVVPTLVQLGVGGGLVAPGAAAVAIVVAHRRGRRLRSRSDIALALGAPVLGRLTTTPEPLPEVRSLARIRRVVPGPRPPAAVGGEELHHGRVLDRLYGEFGASTRWVAVALEDDPDAQRAADRLVRTDRERQRGVPVDPALRGGAVAVVVVPPALPALPDVRNAAAAIVLLTPGTRSGEELLAVAEACADARCPARGALVVEQAAEGRTVILPGNGIGTATVTGDGGPGQGDRERTEHRAAARNGQHVGGMS